MVKNGTDLPGNKRENYTLRRAVAATLIGASALGLAKLGYEVMNPDKPAAHEVVGATLDESVKEVQLHDGARLRFYPSTDPGNLVIELSLGDRDSIDIDIEGSDVYKYKDVANGDWYSANRDKVLQSVEKQLNSIKAAEPGVTRNKLKSELSELQEKLESADDIQDVWVNSQTIDVERSSD